jgi:SAM-dependent methyltransferase
MIDKYKSNMDLLGVQHGNTHAVVGDLLSDLPKPRALADAQYHGFDLITVGAALHHFPNTENAVERLAERLRPGGVLYIQDKFDDGNRGASVSQGPRGFTKEGLEDIMSSAGLVGFGFEVLPNKVDVELLDEKVVSIQCFIGRAVKPIEG